MGLFRRSEKEEEFCCVEKESEGWLESVPKVGPADKEDPKVYAFEVSVDCPKVPKEEGRSPPVEALVDSLVLSGETRSGEMADGASWSLLRVFSMSLLVFVSVFVVSGLLSGLIARSSPKSLVKPM